MIKKSINPIKLFLFGDSICFGQLVSGHNTWAVKLSQSLENSSILNNDILIQNAGVNGNTTRQALERLHFDVNSHRPDYILLQFGMNDCNYWESDYGLPRVSPDSFRSNLEEIAQKCFASGVKRLILNTNHPTLKGSFKHLNRITYDQSNKQYNNYIRESYEKLLHDGYPIILNDIEIYWNNFLEANSSNFHLRNLLLTDGIHLSVKGHELYTKCILPLIKAVLKSDEM
jgi:acyl-CoA thioesterase-1